MADEALRERLLELIGQRLFRVGYRTMNVDEISQAAGISKRTLYEIFASKEEMATEAIDRFIKQVREDTEELIRAHQDPIERLQAITRFIGEQVAKMEQPFFQDLERSLPHLWWKVEELRESRIRELHSSISEGIAQGVMRDDADPQIVVLALIGAVNAVITPGVLAESSFSAREAIQIISSIFNRGMAAMERG